MSKHVQPANSHGSLKDIQLLINVKPELLSAALSSRFGAKDFHQIKWVSPLACESFAEYRDGDFLQALCLHPEQRALEQFWPRRGPQWDALGINAAGHPVLVEAKANLPELVSPPSGASKEALLRIQTSLQEVKDYLGVRDRVDWSGKFYQYTNRLAHLYFLRVLNRIPAYLAFVYFINDKTVSGPTSSQEWLAAISVVRAYLGLGKDRLQKYIADVFINVQDL